MDKPLICHKCGGSLVQYGALEHFLLCQICGLVVTKSAAEARAEEVDDG